MNGNVLVPFLLTAVAGLATGIGSLISFFVKKTNVWFLSFCLGFSAGVMIYVSFIEIFPKATEALSTSFSDNVAYLYATLAFFCGILSIFLLDLILPNESVSMEKVNAEKGDKKGLLRAGTLTAFAIALHNFPEGLATFVSAYQSPALATPIVVAIAIHNVPEGIATSLPIYYSTGSKKKAFIVSLLSGLTEPLGAILGFLLLMPILSDTVFGLLFAFVAGIMVFISVNDLIPSARDYGKHSLMIWGFIGGMAIMGLGLLLLA